jgi:hypothetical protein
MARGAITCDICGNETARVVAKLYLAPKTGTKSDHANYTAHADVGVCCGPRIVKDIRWQQRKKVPRKAKAQA